MNGEETKKNHTDRAEELTDAHPKEADGSGTDKHPQMPDGRVEEVTTAQRFAMFLICVFVLFLAVRFLTGEKREYSENENRTLAALPELSAETIRDGGYTSGLEKYISDQFPMRDGFLSVMTEAQRISGRKEINGVYPARDGSMIRVYDEPQNTERIITQFRKLTENVADQDIPVRLMLVPSAVSICRDLLPAFAPTGTPSQEETIAQIYAAVGDVMETVDAASALRQEYERQSSGVSPEPDGAARMTQPLYYRTDHHWTTFGAYIGYRTYCEAAGLDPKPLSAYEEETVSTDFRGTVYARLNDPHFGYDNIVSYTDPTQELTVTYEDTGEVSDSLYNAEYLTQRDQYSFFLNNIHPLITVTNEAVPEGALALVKDSYANSLLPFLVSNYHTIYVFDTRYYRGSPSAFIREHEDITDVLILYNMNTIDSDTGIGGIF